MRWCLWLKEASCAELRSMPKIMERIQRVKDFPCEKPTPMPTRQSAKTPNLFFYISQPQTQFIAIPEVSSIRRRYIPMGFLKPSIIASNKIYIIPSPNLYIFGVLCSGMHMAWVRQLCGRLKSDFQYSGSMVYNSFPWPTPTASTANA